MPLYKLRLKTGAICILLKNLNIEQGLCNGTRIIIRQLKSNIVIGQILDGLYKDKIVEIPRVYNYTSKSEPINSSIKRKKCVELAANPPLELHPAKTFFFWEKKIV